MANDQGHADALFIEADGSHSIWLSSTMHRAIEQHRLLIVAAPVHY